MKKLISITLLLFCIIQKTYANENILFLTDIHFNPYGLCKNQPCPVLTNLIAHEVKYWPQILANDNAINYRIETSNGFLLTGLKTLMPIAKQNNVKNIFLTGDILTHRFDRLYFKYVDKKYSNQQNFTEFSLKASKYIFNQIKAATNNAKIFYILGNNDGDNPDYKIPSSQYLFNISQSISKQLPLSEKADFEADFSKAGYFHIALNKKTIVIGINSNLLSLVDTNITLATRQLEWLEKTLNTAQKYKQHAILLQHIPYGPDFYKSAISRLPIMLLDAKLQEQYLAIINRYSNNISGIYAGHFHADYFELLSKSNIPLISTIAFNSLFGNNPGFKILHLDENGYLYNYTTYYSDLTLDKTLNWQIEYELNSTYPQDIIHIIKTLSTNNQNRAMYRLFYNGNSKNFPAPISTDLSWVYYACALTNQAKLEYTRCLDSANFKGSIKDYLINYFSVVANNIFIFGITQERLALLATRLNSL